MSRNSKNARNMAIARSQPKNRSAAARARRESGQVRKQGRAAAPNHGKKHAWWQLGLTYSEFLKGGGKKKRSKKEEAGVVEVEITADAAT